MVYFKQNSRHVYTELNQTNAYINKNSCLEVETVCFEQSEKK